MYVCVYMYKYRHHWTSTNQDRERNIVQETDAAIVMQIRFYRNISQCYLAISYCNTAGPLNSSWVAQRAFAHTRPFRPSVVWNARSFPEIIQNSNWGSPTIIKIHRQFNKARAVSVNLLLFINSFITELFTELYIIFISNRSLRIKFSNYIIIYLYLYSSAK